jgi:hypothetical protein
MSDNTLPLNHTIFGLLLIITAVTFLIMSLLLYGNSYDGNTGTFLWILVGIQSLLLISAISGIFMENKWLTILMFIAQYIVGVVTLLISEKYQTIPIISRQEVLANLAPNQTMSFDISTNWQYILLHIGNVLMMILGIFCVVPTVPN